ncbi:aluminum-activated malate transporter 2 isoform X2 [Ziziphus jujuba]|uniref:Aluminum-activated malate transporter 2 isoform X2 n=1 Tax=Ziziphus jujuba TaxID=326968 RepID=A0A6P3Z7Y3_ZIZJJ|nr:aluminum-activated malate transporter 2 isoform X2 [Ziziphus jujuba]
MVAMASQLHKDEDVSGGRLGFGRVKALFEKLKNWVVEIAMKTKKLGEDDPRRIVHSLKVGLAVSLVSLFYNFDFVYDGFGSSAMWAVLTVVVVFEFSVGATLGRGLNRGLATFLAGALGFGAHHLANLSGDKVQPILLTLFVFLLAACVTFIRFFPRMKARYDYGLLIFILTFCMISVSGYRDEEILEMAHKRVSTILIGGLTALSVCILICPVWAGDDLHNSVANNIEKLGNFLEGFGNVYFKKSEDGESNKAVLQGYKSVLNLKQSEESQVNFARWEPRHGKFRFRHPWKHYLTVGTLTRQCAYRIDALNGYIQSEIQAPLEIGSEMEEACMKMSSESGKALKELAATMRTMTLPCSGGGAAPHIAKSRLAAKSLKSLLKLKTGLMLEDNTSDLLNLVPAATVASLLVDVVCCTEKIDKAIEELASLAKFKSSEPTMEDHKPKLNRQMAFLQQRSTSFGPHHVVTIRQTSQCRHDQAHKDEK